MITSIQDFTAHQWRSQGAVYGVVPTLGLHQKETSKELQRARTVRAAIDVGANAAILLARFSPLGKYVPAAVKAFASNNPILLRAVGFFVSPGAVVMEAGTRMAEKGVRTVSTLSWSQGVRSLDKVAGKKIALAALCFTAAAYALYRAHSWHYFGSLSDDFSRWCAGAKQRTSAHQLEDQLQQTKNSLGTARINYKQEKKALSEAISELAQVKQGAEQLQEQLDLNELQLSTVRADASKLEAEVSKLETQAGEQAKLIQEHEATIAHLKENNQRLGRDSLRNLRELEEAQNKLRDMRQEYDAAQARVEEIRSHIAKIESAENGAEAQEATSTQPSSQPARQLGAMEMTEEDTPSLFGTSQNANNSAAWQTNTGSGFRISPAPSNMNE